MDIFQFPTLIPVLISECVISAMIFMHPSAVIKIYYEPNLAWPVLYIGE